MVGNKFVELIYVLDAGVLGPSRQNKTGIHNQTIQWTVHRIKPCWNKRK